MRRLLVSLLWLLALGCGDGADTQSETRIWLYNLDFATRFKLPIEGVEKLDPGLEAVAILVQPQLTQTDPCQLRLFLDASKVSILDSVESFRSPGYLRQVDLFSMLQEFSPRDAAFATQRWNDASIGRILLGTASGPDGEFAAEQSPLLRLFERELLPGLSVVQFSFACSAYSPNGPPLIVRIRKSGIGQMEFLPEGGDEASFSFSIPPRLLRGAWPALVAAEKTISLEAPLAPEFEVPEHSAP